MRLSKLLKEGNFSGKTFISVDIQPEYEKFLGYKASEFVEFLNNHYSEFRNVVFLYNGYDTLGMVSEGDYRMWLMEAGLSEEVMESAKFYDKGYAFFRSCMDNGVDEGDIVDFVRFLVRNGINDSRDMTKEKWKEFIHNEGHPISRDELVALLENGDEMISIPDLMEFLKRYNNIVVTGGGINECLKEVEIALKALDKPYEVYSEFTY
jgi:hypothetical protein